MHFRRYVWGMIGVVVLLFSSFTPPDTTGEITIVAASDLRFAMDSAVAVFKKANPTCKVTVIYGSSGKFFQQIVHGGPFDLFFSADKEYPLALQQQQLTTSPVRLYAIGRIVLWSKKVNPTTKGMNTLLEPGIKTVAIANPAHAPYGKRAKESLIYYKLYNKLESRLVLGENISQTAQFVTTGAADAGILALSLALSPELQKTGHYYLIPATSHKPLEQAFVVLKRTENPKAAEAFATFIGSAAARKILTKFGFTLPTP